MRFLNNLHDRVIEIIVTDESRGYVHGRWKRGSMLSWWRGRWWRRGSYGRTLARALMTTDLRRA
jgi:hypothetical protein